MKTVIRNSYTPKLGDYCDTIVVDKETSSVYFFDCDGVWTEIDKIEAELFKIIVFALFGKYISKILCTKNHHLIYFSFPNFHIFHSRKILYQKELK